MQNKIKTPEINQGFLLSLALQNVQKMETNLDNLTEVWKDVPGYEGLYQVSNIGNVKSLSVYKKRGRYFHLRPEIILKPSIKKRGYLQVTLHNSKGEKRYIGIHQLVALAFIPNPERKPTVNHEDGNPRNNLKSNLEWATCKEQIAHADDSGLRNVKGSASKLSKLTESQVLEIRSSYPAISVKELSAKFQVYRTAVHKIINRQTWKHI